MKVYGTSTPRIAIAFAALAMSVVTIEAVVVLPLALEGPRADAVPAARYAAGRRAAARPHDPPRQAHEASPRGG